MSEPRFTAEDKALCAEREIKQRERVYPRLIAQGRLIPEWARREIDLMREIADDYRKTARKDQLI